jgi:HPt (histidine-containing phosphotransfer) domain-containing protein
MTEFAERMAALRVRFIARAAADREALLQALDTRDLGVLRRTSHGLAGTAGIFGFAALGNAAQQVEDALDAGAAWTEVQEHCRLLTEALATSPAEPSY